MQTSKSSLLGLLAICTLAGSAACSPVVAEQPPETISVGSRAQTLEQTLQLTPAQQRTLLEEATEMYRRGTELATADQIESQELFQRAAEKYELLVKSGVSNSHLFVNLGNAYLQAGRMGRSIASYERGLQLDPNHVQARVNRDFVLDWVEQQQSSELRATLPATSTAESLMTKLRQQHERVVSVLGYQNRLRIFGLTSLAFWGLAIARTLGLPQWVGRLAAFPLLILLLTGGSIALSLSRPENAEAVIAERSVTLRAGDGGEFDEVARLEGVDGRRVRILEDRVDWLKVAVGERNGWIPASQLARLP